MIAVIFEVYIKDGHQQEYLEVAKKLKPILEKIEGFISVERFKSVQDEHKMVSLSFWENETAIEQWRNEVEHRNGQAKGRKSVFSDYRIRVGRIFRDYGLTQREQAPKDSNQWHLGEKTKN